MRVPSASELIGAWEHGRDRDPVERALVLLALSDPGATREHHASLSVRDSDRRLLSLHERLFGGLLRGVGNCATCRAQLEFSLDSKAVLADPEAAESGTYELQSGELRVKFRWPNNADLLAVLPLADAGLMRRAIAERCIIEALAGVTPVVTATLPSPIHGEIAAALSAKDPLADITVALACDACGGQTELSLDIASFLWAEVQSFVRVTLEQVHRLAWAYGWREEDILAMSAARREFYLERIS